ncbi:hypothetical protein [Streptomyces qaidamensis]|uniref:hypothetical protein n=1 Tax=Streptomyces qaidamensis TaxID=1783515 RepID=UPI000A83F3B3|nr:hypothetical protein [Streptomyces qaidamensis]
MVEPEGSTGAPAIGAPVAARDVLDDRLNPVPVGVAGEVGGPQVAPVIEVSLV